MSRWTCPICNYQNSYSTRACIKRCGGQQSDARKARAFKPIRVSAIRQEELARTNELYQGIRIAKLASEWNRKPIA